MEHLTAAEELFQKVYLAERSAGDQLSLLLHTARAVFDRALVVQLRAEGDPPVESGPQPSGCCRQLCQKVPKPVLNDVPRGRGGLDLTALR